MRNKTENNGKIIMKCFGRFELTYAGKSLLKGKTKESQVSSLLQYILHAGKIGVSRERLEEVLFEKRDVEDKHHALQSVIYNAKKKLEAIGLPKTNYIVQKDGVFYWNDEIEVVEDARAFEKMYRKALSEKCTEKQLEYYTAACYLYTDDFLPGYSMFIWAAEESRRYQQVFDECVRSAIAILKEMKDYCRIVEIAEYAAEKIKYEGYEMLAMDAYIEMGSYQEAMKFYKQVEKQYMETQNVVPTEEYDDYIEELAKKVTNAIDGLEEIEKKMSIEQEQGAFYCTYPIFKGFYQIIRISLSRLEYQGSLMLCTLVDEQERPLKRGSISDEVMIQLKNAIACNVRNGDVLTKYSYGQYLILLSEIGVDRCPIIQKRINDYFKKREKKYKIQYTYRQIKPYTKKEIRDL